MTKYKYNPLHKIGLETKENYCPQPIVDSSSTNTLGFTSTNDIVVKGLFLDQITSVVSNSINNVGSLTINSFTINSYQELIVNVTTDNNVDDHIITLKGICEDVVLPTISVLNITVIIPNTTGVAPELWTKSTVATNSAIVGNGTFEAENNNGNNWDEHAYFGSVTSTTRIDFLMTLDRLSGASGAYCFVRFNNTNTPGTVGNPRIYIQNASTLLAYNSIGTGTTIGTASQGDIIRVSFTPTSMEVFQNGNLIYTDTSTYNLTNMFPTFTAFRVFRATNIQLQIF